MSTNDKHRGRREPTLGNLDHVDTPAPPPEPEDDLPRVDIGDDRGPRAYRSRPPAPRRSGSPPHRAPSAWRSWLWPLLAIALVALLALAWINQDRLRGMLPRTHLNTMLIKADKALAAGNLEGDNGDSAHELYAKVLRLEPDNSHALDGLHQVGQAELARAASAIKAKNFTVAKTSIANARRLLGGGADVQKLDEQLRQAEHPKKEIHATIDKAQKAMANGNVAGAGGAAEMYQDVLKVAPDNAVARHGLEQAGDTLAARARRALRQGDIDTAATLIGQLGGLQPHNGDLPALRARLSQARQATAAAIKQHLKQGRADLHAGRFTGEGDNNALAQFKTVQKLDAENAEARAGLRQVAQALILRANAAIDGGDTSQAQALLKQAAELAPKSPDLAAARKRLSAMHEETPATSTKNPVADTQAHPDLTPLQKVEIRHLITRAAAAARAGNIMLPPGDSAYDLYNEALTIDANNAEARAGINSLADRALTSFNKAVAAHQLQRADGYLATLRSLDPGNAKADALNRKLANAWLDRARSSMDEGNRIAALKALKAARKLAPDAPRIKSVARDLGE